MIRSRRSARRLAFAFVLVVVVGGCTNATDRPPEATGSPTGPASPTISPGVSVGPTPVFDDDDRVLRVAVSEPATLDPMRIQDPGSMLIARQLYEGLVRWDPVEEEVVPAAAASWSVSGGGRTFTFELNPGMTFHDGSPVTAADFKFAFDRIAAKSNASDLAYVLEPVEGFHAANRLGTAGGLSGVRAVSERRLVIELSQPFQGFLEVLTHPGLVPVPRDKVADLDRFLVSPTGNGAFQMAAPWSAGQPAVLRAFAGFLRTPSIDGIIFTPFEDSATSWIPFRHGEIDVAEVPAGQFDAARERFGEQGFRPILAGYYFGFNVDSEPFDRLKVRRAVSRAIDRRQIHRSVFRGTMIEPRGIVPEGMPGFEADLCLPGCTYSPAAARRMVDDIPRRSRSIVIDFTRGHPHGRVARAVAQDLRAVGFRVKTRGYAFPRYLRRLRAGTQNMYRLGWVAEYPTPDAFLTALFDPDSPDNHSGFRSSKVDRLLARARAEPSPGKRVQLYKEVEQIVLAKMPVVPIGSFLGHWVARPRVRDIHFDVMGGFDAAGISLAPQR